ncbi:MAG: TetR/AcrR family transcriptional regulator [Oscillospiraceae bacterium]
MSRINTTKAKITKVAWKLFNEKGYDETTIDDIISESGTSKGSFYHYYSSKDELLSSLSEVFDEKYEEVMQTLDPEMNSYDKLLYLCYSVHDMIEKEIPIGLLSSLYSSQVTTKGDKHLQDQNRYYFQIITQLVTEGQFRGQITADLPNYKIQKLYTLAERAIIYDYCISSGNYSLGEYTREIMPRLFCSVQVK